MEQVVAMARERLGGVGEVGDENVVRAAVPCAEDAGGDGVIGEDPGADRYKVYAATSHTRKSVNNMH